MDNTSTKLIAVVTGICIAASVAGCANTTLQARSTAPRSADLALAVPAGGAAGEVEVVVFGRDMPSPISADLPIVDGVARGTVRDVDEGQLRHVLVLAFTADGRRCSRELTTNIAVGVVNSIEVASLQCEARATASIQDTARIGLPQVPGALPPVF